MRYARVREKNSAKNSLFYFCLAPFNAIIPIINQGDNL